ncbi:MULTISPECIES: response regulator [unclassified Mesorhizobium]|uniref:response regulator n=1 Tax=unclassified Mesorhizobium TaxID=325217 RepID=UPI001093A92A|nr:MULTISPECIES: response regulator [unclassified Mesorhizobium]TGS45645.1 response regulator [Mesorhizobium sp. M8A.F.Ca.ET.182.01.1.1]TGS81100.1 response regulator [Mesorhizobium sp. M8A.F.Ca.ET.181.01.1.1]
MLIYPLQTYKSNAKLADFYKRQSTSLNIAHRRGSVKIAAIDDEPFSPQTSLKAFGYNIDHIGDIKSVSEIKDYPIVLCDLMGVGIHFDKSSQGATIIREIKKNYPAIIVVAYTGSSLGSLQARAAKDYADAVIKKDADNSEWSSALDGLLDQALDPHAVWKRIRASLVAADVDTIDLVVLEDAYVHAILSRDSSFARLSAAVKDRGLSGDARSIVQGIISSAIFKLIVG